MASVVHSPPHWKFLEPRSLLVGSSEHVVERVHQLAEVCGLEYLRLGYVHPGLPQRLTLRSLELFGTQLMPRFRDGWMPVPPPSAVSPDPR